MRTIYKYTLEPGEQQLPLPCGSQLRSAIEQNGEIVCYAEVDQAEQGTELHTFHVYGTGHPICQRRRGEVLGYGEARAVRVSCVSPAALPSPRMSQLSEIEHALGLLQQVNISLAQVSAGELKLADRVQLTKLNNEMVKIVTRINLMRPYML